jgi:hypothetical protein
MHKENEKDDGKIDMNLECVSSLHKNLGRKSLPCHLWQAITYHTSHPCRENMEEEWSGGVELFIG